MDNDNQDLGVQATREAEQILKQTLGVSVTLTRTTFMKNNGHVKKAIIAKIKGDSSSPTIYTDIDKRLQNGETVTEIATELAASVLTAIEAKPDFDVSSITAPNAPHHITLEVINAEKNRELLRRTPHYIIADGDLAVIPRWKITNDASFVITNDITSNLGMTNDEVLKIGQNNINQTDFSIKTMRETMLDIFAKDGMDPSFAEAMLPEGEGTDMIVMTTQDNYMGAKGLLSKKALDTIKEKLEGQDFFILPTSVHDVICIADNGKMKLSDLKEMVQSVNATEVSPQDFLSNNVFKYDGNKLKLAVDDLKMTIDNTTKFVMDGMRAPAKMAMKM